MGSLTSPANHVALKMKEMGPTGVRICVRNRHLCMSVVKSLTLICRGFKRMVVNGTWLFYHFLPIGIRKDFSARLFNLCPEMRANEFRCSLRIGITNCHFHIAPYLTELCVFW